MNFIFSRSSCIDVDLDPNEIDKSMDNLNHPATLFQPSELCRQGFGCQQFVTGLEDAIGINKYHWFIN
jgi:hypothetical protein